MNNLSEIFLVVHTFLLGVLILGGYFFQMKKEKSCWKDEKTKSDATIQLTELVVIIPFRNEEKRIPTLLNSILSSIELPKEFIFIDDHSTDKGAELIVNSLKNIPYRILKSPIGQEGKKQAIRYGIQESTPDYILSMDADIEFSESYFSKLKELKVADMYILPAILKAKKWYEHIYEVDLILVNAANCGIAGWKRPILASGANLLYKRSSFEQFDRYDSHAHMSSGDDIYLLRDFREAKADIRLMTETSVAIHTETPQSLKEFIHQRLRWIAKTGDVRDHLSTTLAIVQVLLTFSFVALLVFFTIKGEWKQFWIVFLLKSCIDLFLFLPYFNRIKCMKSWLFIPIYEIIFPVYSLVILGMMFFFKPVWKGRQ